MAAATAAAAAADAPRRTTPLAATGTAAAAAATDRADDNSAQRPTTAGGAASASPLPPPHLPSPAPCPRPWQVSRRRRSPMGGWTLSALLRLALWPAGGVWLSPVVAAAHAGSPVCARRPLQGTSGGEGGGWSLRCALRPRWGWGRVATFARIFRLLGTRRVRFDLQYTHIEDSQFLRTWIPSPTRTAHGGAVHKIRWGRPIHCCHCDVPHSISWLRICAGRCRCGQPSKSDQRQKSSPRACRCGERDLVGAPSWSQGGTTWTTMRSLLTPPLYFRSLLPPLASAAALTLHAGAMHELLLCARGAGEAQSFLLDRQSTKKIEKCSFVFDTRRTFRHVGSVEVTLG